jgi:limonene-1,2-epoxide hydrolase
VVPPTGRTLALRFCEIFEVEAGRIATQRTYFDQMKFAQQLGLIPATA